MQEDVIKELFKIIERFANRADFNTYGEVATMGQFENHEDIIWLKEELQPFILSSISQAKKEGRKQGVEEFLKSEEGKVYLDYEKSIKQEQERIWSYVEEYAENHPSDDAGFYHYPTVMKDLSNIIFDKS